MYTDKISTQEQALTHLFFHCCLRDGSFSDPEIKIVSDMLVASGLNKTVNFKEEVISYKSYHPFIEDENSYLQTLINLIRPTNDLALYSYCTELCLSDSMLSPDEENLLDHLASVLAIEEAEQAVTKKLMVQRKVVETQKIF